MTYVRNAYILSDRIIVLSNNKDAFTEIKSHLFAKQRTENHENSRKKGEQKNNDQFNAVTESSVFDACDPYYRHNCGIEIVEFSIYNKEKRKEVAIAPNHLQKITHHDDSMHRIAFESSEINIVRLELFIRIRSRCAYVF